MHTILSVDLILRNNDLCAVAIIGVRDGVLEETDCSDNFAILNNSQLPAFCISSTEVAGITDDLLGLDSLFTTPDADEFAISIGDNFIDLLVEHVGATVDGRKTCK